MILFTSDLLFGSKILGAAKFAGLRGQGIRSRAALDTHAPNASHFFLDLETELAEGESPEALLDAALGHPHLRVFAFAGHMHTDKLRAAQSRLSASKVVEPSAASDAVRHEVHSRGSLASRLAEILPPRIAEQR
ncbi:MAG: hypothetical protein QM516_08850 [Limnohabitans sp.]|jgi:hypothetical protein|nr:hypothetical protein [Limnohabitans sp.]